MGPPSTKVFIGNLPDDCDVDQLRKVFEAAGSIAEMDVIRNYGFVHYDTEAEAKKAVSELNGTDFEGFSLKVEQSRSTVRHKPGMGDMTECYRCGKSGHWSKDCMSGGRGRGRGRGRGGPMGPPGPFRDPYDDPYADPYYRRRLPPPPPYDRYAPYDPYERRRIALERAREWEYYDRLAAREAYYDYYARRAYAMEASRGGHHGREAYPPPPPPRSDPAQRSRVPGPY